METHLTIKHLAGYLPYGLKFLPTHYNPDKRIDTLYYLSTINSSEEFSVNGYTSNYIKPILRPLSDLIKEIEVSREKFVPLLKIAESLGIKYSKYKINGNSIDFVLDTSYKRPNTKTKEPRKTRFWFNNYKAGTFAFTGCIAMIYLNQIEAIEKLYEWHFDIHGLIEKGLAIDINTLNKQP